mmetsp:Transcript_9566/g.21356  ORF Transcript_9566/g.21356 Transcript_9566/m.21356 type:complete len:267 (-) Transcript_9566:1953-2753(-)
MQSRLRVVELLLQPLLPVLGGFLIGFTYFEAFAQTPASFRFRLQRRHFLLQLLELRLVLSCKRFSLIGQTSIQPRLALLGESCRLFFELRPQRPLGCLSIALALHQLSLELLHQLLISICTRYTSFEISAGVLETLQLQTHLVELLLQRTLGCIRILAGCGCRGLQSLQLHNVVVELLLQLRGCHCSCSARGSRGIFQLLQLTSLLVEEFLAVCNLRLGIIIALLQSLPPLLLFRQCRLETHEPSIPLGSHGFLLLLQHRLHVLQL